MMSVWTVFRKEIKEMLRDKKTLFITLITPLLVIPFIMSITIMSTTRMQENVVNRLDVAVSDTDNPIAEALGQIENINLVSIDNPIESISTGNALVYIEFPEDAKETFEGKSKIQLKISYNSSIVESQIALAVVEEYINAISKAYMYAKMEEYDFPTEYAEKIGVEYTDCNTKQNSPIIITLLPMLLITYCLFGISAASNDMGAGEKERCTLEPLLSTGVDRNAIMIGKYLAICVPGIVCSMCSLLGFSLFVNISPSCGINVGLVNCLLIFVLAVLVTFCFTGLCFSLSMFAKSAKEAQTYTSIITTLSILPSLAVSSTDTSSIAIESFAVPIMNVAYCLKEILLDALVWEHFVVTVVSMCICTIVFNLITRHLFCKESVVFRK